MVKRAVVPDDDAVVGYSPVILLAKRVSLVERRMSERTLNPSGPRQYGSDCPVADGDASASASLVYGKRRSDWLLQLIAVPSRRCTRRRSA